MRVVDGADRPTWSSSSTARAAGRGQTGVRACRVGAAPEPEPDDARSRRPAPVLRRDAARFDRCRDRRSVPLAPAGVFRVMNGSSTLLDRPITAADGDAFGIVFGTRRSRFRSTCAVDLALVADLTDLGGHGDRAPRPRRHEPVRRAQRDERRAHPGLLHAVVDRGPRGAHPGRVRLDGAAATPELPATVAVGIPTLAMTVTAAASRRAGGLADSLATVSSSSAAIRPTPRSRPPSSCIAWWC